MCTLTFVRPENHTILNIGSGVCRSEAALSERNEELERKLEDMNRMLSAATTSEAAAVAKAAELEQVSCLVQFPSNVTGPKESGPCTCDDMRASTHSMCQYLPLAGGGAVDRPSTAARGSGKCRCDSRTR